MKALTIILFLTIYSNLVAQDKNQALLIGTFHFHLVGSQFQTDFDINSEENQTSLNELAKKIARFQPTKIFVEWEATKQEELNELYALYLQDSTGSLIKSKYGANETMYFDSEVQQLGFRIAKVMKHPTVFGFDYPLLEPNDTIMHAIQQYEQFALMKEIETEFGAYGQKILNIFQQTSSLKKLLQFFNSKELDQQLNSGYISLFNKIGSKNNLAGAYFVSERYRRNLYMYSLIQQQLASSNERVVILVGAQHAAAFRELIGHDTSIELISTKPFLK